MSDKEACRLWHFPKINFCSTCAGNYVLHIGCENWQSSEGIAEFVATLDIRENGQFRWPFVRV